METKFLQKFLAPKSGVLKYAAMFKNGFVLALLGILSTIPTFGQDIHFSQFYNAPLNISPALTGIFQGDIRFTTNYRSQWESVPVSYRTFSASVDMKFLSPKFKRSFFSGGIIANHDQAGTSKLTAINLGLTGSYTRQLSSNIYSTAGALFSFNQRYFKINDLLFDRQWNGDVVDPNLPTGEAFSNTSNVFFDFSAGLNFRWQKSTNANVVNRLEKRSKVDFGVALFHIAEPDQAFHEDDEVSLFTRLSPYIHSQLQIGKNVDMVANGSVQIQGPYQEALVVIGTKYYLDRGLGKQKAIQANIGYRFDVFGDAVFFGGEVFLNPILPNFGHEIHLGFTYDWNISDFDAATSKYGGVEFSIRYIITKVKPLPIFKICPLI